MKIVFSVIQKAHFAGLFCLTCLILAGCDRPAVFGDRHPVPADLPSPSLASLTISDDLSSIGLRRPVEALISTEIESIEKRKAWIGYAKAIQASFGVDPLSDGPDTSQAQQRYVNALACLRGSNDDDEFRSALVSRIHALTFDSPLRKSAWQSFQSVLLAKSIKPKTDPCSE